VAPYTFTYRINGGANQTVTTTTGSMVTVAASTAVSGSFTYTLISLRDGSSTACLNTASGSVTVTVFAMPEPAVITTADPHLCNGGSGVIQVLNYQTGNTYQWTFNGRPLKNSTLDTIVNNAPGTFAVQVVNPQGCRAGSLSNEVKISTGNVPTPVILGQLKVCEGGQTQLIATNTGQSFEVWRWTDPPEKASPRKVYGWDSSFFAGAGQYQVMVMAQGCYDSTTVSVTANDTEHPAGQLTSSTDTISFGEAVRFEAEIKGASEFRWDFGDGNSAVTTNPIVTQHYFLARDSVHVQLDAVSARNCITHFEKWLTVRPQATPPPPALFVTGNVKDWNVFPIPFHDHLNLSVVLERGQEVAIQLYTADGKLVRRWSKQGVRGEQVMSLEGVGDLPAQVMYFIFAVYNGQRHFDKAYKQ
jgi:hypothetical protein